MAENKKRKTMVNPDVATTVNKLLQTDEKIKAMNAYRYSKAGDLTTDVQGALLATANLHGPALWTRLGGLTYDFMSKLRPNSVGNYEDKAWKDETIDSIAFTYLIAIRTQRPFPVEYIEEMIAESNTFLSPEYRRKKHNREVKRENRAKHVANGEPYR
jgi:hypothetical protein